MCSYGMLAYTQASREANQGLKSIHTFRPQIYSYGQCPENKSVMSKQKNHQISSYPRCCSLTSAGSSAALSCSLTLLRWGGGENWKSERV